jgi:hypothetical protein
MCNSSLVTLHVVLRAQRDVPTNQRPYYGEGYIPVIYPSPSWFFSPFQTPAFVPAIGGGNQVQYVRCEPTHPASTSRNRRHCSVSPLSGRSNSSGTRAAPCESQHVSVAATNVVDHAPIAIAGNAPTPEIPARSALENDTEDCIHAGSAPVGEDEVPLSQVFRIARTHSHATAHVSFTHPRLLVWLPLISACVHRSGLDFGVDVRTHCLMSPCLAESCTWY